MAVRKTSKKLPVYQLKVTIKDLQPPVWRRVQVTSDLTLADLHTIIQAIMGWEGNHLYSFEAAGTEYGKPTQDGLRHFESDQIELRQIISGSTLKLTYVYGHGDDWQHEILVEKVMPHNSEISYPICLQGERACPPDDCGGISGYRELLEILQVTQHPEYKERLEGAGPIDPEAFDLEHVNQQLNSLSMN